VGGNEGTYLVLLVQVSTVSSTSLLVLFLPLLGHRKNSTGKLREILVVSRAKRCPRSQSLPPVRPVRRPRQGEILAALMSEAAGRWQLYCYSILFAVHAVAEAARVGAFGCEALVAAWSLAAVVFGGAPAVLGPAQLLAALAGARGRSDADWCAALASGCVAVACLSSPGGGGEAAARARSGVRAVLAAILGSSALWKGNTAFFDPAVSCASVRGVRLLARGVKAARTRFTVEGAARAAAYAPAAALAAEARLPAPKALGHTRGAPPPGAQALAASAAVLAPRVGGLLLALSLAAAVAAPPPTGGAADALRTAPLLVFLASARGARRAGRATDFCGIAVAAGLLAACGFEANAHFDWRAWSSERWAGGLFVGVGAFAPRGVQKKDGTGRFPRETRARLSSRVSTREIRDLVAKGARARTGGGSRSIRANGPWT